MAAEFDSFAARYDEDLERGLALTGEDKSYFAIRRVQVIGRILERLRVDPRSVLDYGCGTGTAIPLLRALLGAKRIVGVDPSTASLDRARLEVTLPDVSFVPLGDYRPAGDADLVFTNGVFHHVPTADRPSATALVYRSLRPGGVLAFWENNPWNPGTRWVMRRVAFDRDAILLTPPAARRMLVAAGFEILSTSYHFVFPRLLRWLRGLEPALTRVPVGGQYLVVARRSG
ncbi:MAG: class I SAM-dependent methyltransferase [Gemmatimonadales bacterium]